MSDQIQGFRLSPQQRWLWLLQSQHGPGACRSRCAVRLRGPLDVPALQAAVQEVIARHEALRTVFRRTPGIRIPIQIVLDEAAISWKGRDLPTEAACDLGRGPLVDAELIHLGEQEHLLVISCPALCADAASFANLLDDVVRLYQDHGSEVDDEVVQYLQFSEWQHEFLEGEEGTAAQERWRGLSRSPRVALPLEAAAGPGEGCNRFAELSLPADLPVRIEALGAELEPFLLTIWYTLLLRLTEGDEPPAVAVVCNQRKHEPLAGSVGPFATALPLRRRLSLSTPCAEAVARISQALGEACDEQDSFMPEDHWNPAAPVADRPFGFELLRWSPSHSAPGLDLSLQRLETPLAPCRLKLTCTLFERSLTARIEYVDGLLPDKAVLALGARFREMIASALEDPQSPLDNLRILSESERHELVCGLNDTRTGPAAADTVHQLFERQAERCPHAVAVETHETKLTYAELDHRANQLARYLRGRGIGPGSLAGLYLDRTPEMVIAVLGVLKSGGAYLPLDPAYPRERLAFLVEDARPALLLTQEPLADSLPSGEVPVLCLDTGWTGVEPYNGESPLEGAAGPDDLAYVIYTSGSTGRPKGVMVPHRGVVNYLTWCAEAYAVATGEGALVHSPLGFDLTVTSLFSPLSAGRKVRLISDDGDLTLLARALQDDRCFSLAKLTPPHLELLRHNLSEAGARVGVRTLVLGGEALFGEALTWWRQLAPDVRLINEYGPTETVVGCCVYEIPTGMPPSGPVPIGRPIANTRLYLLDERLQPVPFGRAGELYIGGEGLARGYLGRPHLTAERFVPDPFEQSPGGRLYKTGDIVRYLADGNLEFLGRNDQQVKIRGFRIELGEIESVLASHPAVREAVVLAREDEHGDRRLVAYLVTGGEIGIDDLRQFVGRHLPDYMIPSHFVRMNAFPLTANGKVDRRAFPAPSTERPALDTTYVAPRTPEEAVLAEIWADVLGVSRVGVFDSFFALGGDSIRSVRLVALVKQRGFELTVQQLYQHHRIADLCPLPQQHSSSPARAGSEADPFELEQLLDQIEGFSDEEVMARLQAQSALAEQESP